jgi:hypothetical protein
MTIPQNEPFSNSVSAGLKVSLGALLAFYWLTGKVPLSILLGAIGGLAIARIVYWLDSKDEPVVEKPIEDESLEDVAVERQAKKRYYARYRRSRKSAIVLPAAFDRLAFWKRE